MALPTESGAGVGLDGVIALRSAVCELDVATGRLAYRGYDVRELASQSSFEETAFLLIGGELPTRTELRLFTAELRGAQKLSPAMARALRLVPGTADPMLALRAALAAAAWESAGPVPPTPELARTQGLRAIAVLPTVVAAFHRIRVGLRPISPRRSLSFAANLLQMLTGAPATPEASRAFDLALILRADNELNPSTFAARITAATGADVLGAVVAATAALAGPRHGWHARKVMEVLEEIGSPEKVPEWMRGRPQGQGKAPGFGHQVYQGEDPRTALLRSEAESRCREAGMDALYRTARALEEAVAREWGQFPMVDFYLAPLYRALGIPTDLFTAIFSVSRMPGWVAHVLEQYTDERLLRPRAQYIGPPARAYVPIRRRG
jgi:citrate synthase